ncbi:MAG: baseplate J/gp47 family protein [Pseudomonadota bacterium]
MQIPIVPPLQNPDARDERANDLLAAGRNGLRLGLVELSGSQALLEVFFINALHVDAILLQAGASEAAAGSTFVVKGGQRLRAGPGAGQVRCTAVAAGQNDGNGDPISLVLTVEPIGDYSTYRVELVFDPAFIDPFFAELPFKFRPGCFTGHCAPPANPGRPRLPAPAIDYLAKDYDSFRHTLINAMMERVPGWQVSSEADLDQTLLDLFAAAADELSDFQDRVMNEAWLATCRQRVSLARHARLVDYHLHQGNQSSTWLALELDPVAPSFSLDEELLAWAGGRAEGAERLWFATRETGLDPARRTLLDPLLNSLRLHTWSGAQPGLAAGATQADLVSDQLGAGQAEAEQLRDWIRDGTLARLLIEEKLNPLTGQLPGRNPRKRQLLRLVSGDGLAAGDLAAREIFDPLTNTWLVRVNWRAEDALRQDYAFETVCPVLGSVANVSAFHGNLLQVHQGLPVSTHFHEPGSPLPAGSDTERHAWFRRWSLYGEERGVLCELPDSPLAYLPTPAGGEVPPRSTLTVSVEPPGGAEESWDEVISLVHSDDTAENGDHFAVETDERSRSRLRFGNGVNGRSIPPGAIVHCRYQVGGGATGNVGANSVVDFLPLSGPLVDAIVAVWNPFDVSDGRDPEPVEKVVRHAPEAFRARQLRAVTLADYEKRAMEVPGVARAVARYAWTGSWRTVRIALDPAGTDLLDPDLAQAAAEHLEAVRLIGEDLEIRPPRFVPLAIEVDLCLHPDFWVEDVRWELEQAFSAGWTGDGGMGFFHPDAWTFGQALHRSQIEGRLAQVAGVDHAVEIRMRRFNLPPPAVAAPDMLEAAFDEIFLVKSDPDHREQGYITFNLGGGRQ